MYGDLGKGLVTFVVGLMCFFPLGVWKLVEILIWFFSHVSWK